MAEPVLIILAAGAATRFGGNKPLFPVGPSGEAIIEYSLFDAAQAGFDKSIIVANSDSINEAQKKLSKASTFLDIHFVVQEIGTPGRTKPWGTGHAVLCGARKLTGPFAVINGDDLYGINAFQEAYDFLSLDSQDCGLLVYPLGPTLSQHGGVSRGVCKHNGEYLEEVTEVLQISRKSGNISGVDAGSGDTIPLDEGTPISTGFWCFRNSVVVSLDDAFQSFVDSSTGSDAEFYIPEYVMASIHDGSQRYRMIEASPEGWAGMTYKEDVPAVRGFLAGQINEGIFPERLWQ